MYKVITLEEAYNDIENIYNYISLKSLSSPLSLWERVRVRALRYYYPNSFLNNSLKIFGFHCHFEAFIH